MKKNRSSLLVLLSICSMNLWADTLFVAGKMTISNDTTFGYVIVGSGDTLVADGIINVDTEMVVGTNGVVSHSAHNLSGLRLNVNATLQIDSAGMIDLNAKGLGGGNNGSAFGDNGETYDSNDSIVSGAQGGVFYTAGGSYGGRGGPGSGGGYVSNEPYGYLENPRHLGSGGGGANATFPGGRGGGKARIKATNCIVNGIIRANGQDGTVGPQTGAGSGGAIRLDVVNLSGSGYIQAIGGTGGILFGNSFGGGGGGRIAIYFATKSFPDSNIYVYGGSGLGGMYPSSAGTLYFQQNGQPTGDLIVDNGNITSVLYTPLRTTLTSFHSLTLQHRGQLQPLSTDLSAFTVEQPTALANNSALWLSNGVTMTDTSSNGFDLDIRSGSIVLLDTSSILNANTISINGGILTTNIDRTFPTGAELELSGGGIMNVLNNRILSVGVFDTTNIKHGKVNLSIGSRLDIASNSMIIGTGDTLVKDGTFGVSDSIGALEVIQGGVITNSPHNLAGLRLHVTGTLQIDSAGMIDLNAKGLGGGNNGSAFGNNGETYGANDSIVEGAQGGNNGYTAAGSYGGRGGPGSGGYSSNEPYGYLEDPRHLGSGGGGSSNSFPGGRGGGMASITATNCIVNGTIRANGQDGVAGPQTGAGSGGAIRLDVVNLSGSGYIQAVGGTGGILFGNSFGGGGGGRIAIYFTTKSFPDSNIYINGGSYGFGNSSEGTNPSSAGTLYLKQNGQSTGDIIVDNRNITSDLYTPFRSMLTVFNSLSLTQGGQIRFGPADTLRISNPIDFDVTIESGSSIQIDSGASLIVDRLSVRGSHSSLIMFQGANLHEMLIDQSGQVDINAQSTCARVTVDGGILNMNAELDITSQLNVTGGGMIRRP